MSRIMTIWLPRWPVQRRLTERPDWRKRPVFVCRREARGLLTVASWAWAEPPKRRRAAIQPGMPLAEAMAGADVFLGVSVKGAVTPEMVASMAAKPIILAMANPDPEITPEEVARVRDDAIVATGRSDYPNQVNNVLCFPYLFRGALDVRATCINEDMKLAAANALADLARQQVPDEVAAAYGGKARSFGQEMPRSPGTRTSR